jgi:hypothetical protein
VGIRYSAVVSERPLNHETMKAGTRQQNRGEVDGWSLCRHSKGKKGRCSVRFWHLHEMVKRVGGDLFGWRRLGAKPDSKHGAGSKEDMLSGKAL